MEKGISYPDNSGIWQLLSGPKVVHNSAAVPPFFWSLSVFMHAVITLVL